MLLKFYIRADNADQIVEAIYDLPEEIRPRYFTDSEGRTDERDVVTDKIRLNTFMRVNPHGFVLIGKKCEYDITLRREEYSTVFVDVKSALSDIEVSRLFTAAANADTEYGFAACDAEYHHRNRVVHEIGENVVEAWVGRDLKQYVPGVFWRTLFSERLILDRGIDLGRVPKCVTVERRNKKWFLLKVAGDVDDWPAHCRDVDSYCESTDSIFSITEVKRETDQAENYVKLTRILGNWK